MATAFSSPPMFGTSSMVSDDDLAADLGVQMDMDMDATAPFQNRDLPPPNPHFVFPMQSAMPSSAPSSFSRTTGRRTQSQIEPFYTPGHDAYSSTMHRSHRPTALPDFSFNPGAGLSSKSPATHLSPPLSSGSASPRTIPSPGRPAGHGHRRGGSEFVGGRLRDGNSISVLGTSPTKSEGELGQSTPTFKPPRRGHRRGVSGAISTNDLPLLPPAPEYSFLKGGSAPNSPTIFDRVDYISLPVAENAAPSLASDKQIEVAKQGSEDNGRGEPNEKSMEAPPKTTPRARVGFSDTLEFIPRPLSLVSSDTSSTMTARPGHSVSGSMSSMISLTAAGGRESPVSLSRSPTVDLAETRPSTAGAVLEGADKPLPEPASNISPRRRNSIPSLINVADPSDVDSPQPSPTKASKRWSFFGLEPRGSGSPTKTRPHSSSSAESASRAMSIGSSSENSSDSLEETVATITIAPTKDKSKSGKKRRVKGWAGAILPRKQKKPSKRIIRPPTPPASEMPLEDEEEDEEMVETLPTPLTPPTVTITDSLGDSDTATSPKRSEDTSYQMIDLDAALGPFNTPLPNNPEWDAAQRAAGNNGKRRLHSAQGMKGFTGPGMHYHRRAESAPDLPPFEAARHLSRFGSSSTMADVFEEDEEDDDRNGHGKKRGSTPITEFEDETTPPAVEVQSVSLDLANEVTHHMQHKNSSLSSVPSDQERCLTPSIRTEQSKTSLNDNIVESSASSFRGAHLRQPRPASSGSAAMSARRSNTPREPPFVDVAPLQLTQPTGGIPLSPYSISLASSHPSPRSPMSVDVQRISTAPSSITDENNFHSLLLGEPGPELRLSCDYDGPPSLTSTESTTTRDSSWNPQARFSQPTLRQPRPASVSLAFGRRRSSLASLSRLINSSHGERSKLSMEVTLDQEAENKKAKKSSKAHRLSKLVQFWKPAKSNNGP